MPTTSLESQAVLIMPTAQGTDAIKQRIQLHKSILVWKHLFRHLTSPQDQLGSVNIFVISPEVILSCRVTMEEV